MNEFPKNRIQASVPRICAPSNIRGRRVSPTSVIVTWDEPYAQCQMCPDAVGYEISGDTVSTVSIARPPCEIKGMDLDPELQLFVVAIAADNIRSNRSPVTIEEIPGTPGNLIVREVTSAYASLEWTASEGNVQVSEYELYVDGIYLASTHELAYLLTPLAGNRTYTVAVRARSLTNGLSDAQEVVFTTPVTSAEYPRNLRVTQNGNKTVAIAWDAPIGHAPTGYKVVLLGKITDVAQTYHTMFNMPFGWPLIIGVQAQYEGNNGSIWVYITVVPAA